MSPTGRLPGAALFDLDGTLVDREPLMLAAVRDVLAGAGRPVDEAGGALDAWVGRAWQDVYRGFEVARDPGWAFDTFMDEVFAAADRLVADGFEVRVLEGARRLIESLHGDGVAIAVVTGSLRREVGPALDLVGVRSLVELVVSADDYDVGKPDPSCFLLAARRLEVDPARCVVFEDSAAGVAAGAAAGMRVVASAAANPPVGHPGHQDLSEAHVVVASLSAVERGMLHV